MLPNTSLIYILFHDFYQKTYKAKANKAITDVTQKPEENGNIISVKNLMTSTYEKPNSEQKQMINGKKIQ